MNDKNRKIARIIVIVIAAANECVQKTADNHHRVVPMGAYEMNLKMKFSYKKAQEAISLC